MGGYQYISNRDSTANYVVSLTFVILFPYYQKIEHHGSIVMVVDAKYLLFANFKQ